MIPVFIQNAVPYRLKKNLQPIHHILKCYFRIAESFQKIPPLDFHTIARLEPHVRGYELEKFLNDLFFFFDLSPRSAFRVNGEQIDGAFTHDNTDYLLEAKWHDAPIERREIDVFSAVIERKLKTTLGLFISINGFVTAAVDSTYKYNSIILMDSYDLIQVLENRIQLPELILRKRRHASETGESMYRVNI